MTVDPEKRRNRRITISAATGAALVLLIACCLVAAGLFVTNLYHQIDDLRAVNDCRSGVAEDERHATLDLLVATGTLFIAAGASTDPTARATALAEYQVVVERAKEINSRSISDVCP